MKHTQGVFKKELRSEDGSLFTIHNGNKNIGIIGLSGKNLNPEESTANAELICDAFNTTNKTGYTPSQLAEQKAEMLEALNYCKSVFEAQLDQDEPYYRAVCKAIKNATTPKA